MSRLRPDAGYGFIETPDGRTVYFHRHSVLDDDFGRRRLGSERAFVEGEERQGPQASAVRLVGKHHHL